MDKYEAQFFMWWVIQKLKKLLLNYMVELTLNGLYKTKKNLNSNMLY